MGCFERSKSGRLHFHGLLYVPDGKMRGNIRKEEYYDTTSYKKGISFINEEFEDKIGRNDFKEITTNDLTFKNALEYILKYIGKSDNKIVYSKLCYNEHIKILHKIIFLKFFKMTLTNLDIRKIVLIKGLLIASLFR